ncbi:hypothetical protein BLNAU_4095 [Blattamonas nauphoetae]|uniref:Uncharacterized protein n=1 Tax=Blattamonas nauphoetae TaxID=2049346 RepID=A0ABQ9YB62_9EUKA|nr:hypothetical protein BLNAU_4095 [Blattamonas nauphoetae]
MNPDFLLQFEKRNQMLSRRSPTQPLFLILCIHIFFGDANAIMQKSTEAVKADVAVGTGSGLIKHTMMRWTLVSSFRDSKTVCSLSF